MHVLAHARTLGHRLDHGLAEVLWVRAREADALDAGDCVAGAEELAELGSQVGREIAAPRVHVLPEQRDLAHAVSYKRRDLGDDLAEPPALLSAPDRRDDAVRALRVAPHRDLHPGLNAPLAVPRQVGREVLMRAELAARNGIPTRADAVAEVGNRAGAEGDVDERVLLEDPLALCLGIAAADSDHEIGTLALPRRRISEVGRKARVRLLAHRAGVEDDHVGGVRIRRLSQ